jgi:tetratricopeptide (TPR) repeat protein
MSQREDNTDQQGRLSESDRLIEEADGYFDAKQFQKARPLYETALNLRVSALGECHESVAVTLNRLANVFYQQKDDVVAGGLFERALAIREIVLSPEACDLRLSVNNLANVYRNQGRFAEAELLYRRSLQMRERETGQANHPAIWRNLVRVLSGQGKNEEASDYSERIRALEASEP